MRKPQISNQPNVTILLTADKLSEMGAESTASLSRHFVGHVRILTGSIVACDPIECRRGPLETQLQPPLEARFPHGEFPVWVGVAHLSNGWKVCAYSVLQFQNVTPQAWEIARVVGDDPTKPMAHAHSVDSGLSCFMDASFAPLFAAKTSDAMENSYRHHLVDEIYHGRLYDVVGVGTCDVRFPEVEGNCIIFQSGVDDGFYWSYIGYDDQGQIASLLTDFQVLRY